MGLRFILLALAVWLIYVIARRLLAQRKIARRPATPLPVLTVRCARCGVHLPREDAVRHRDRDYCCPEHLRDDQIGPADSEER